MNEQSSADDVLLAVGTMRIEEDYVKTLEGIKNDVEQIHEIDQSLTVVSRDIVDEMMKVLQLNNEVLQLENFTESKEVIIYPKGIILIRSIDGDIEPRTLVDLEPPLLYAVLKQLIPKLKESLDDKKRSNENLLAELTKTHESIV